MIAFKRIEPQGFNSNFRMADKILECKIIVQLIFCQKLQYSEISFIGIKF